MQHLQTDPDSGYGNPLNFLACGVFLMIAIRAWHQSITIDEADTALFFAMRDWPAHWHAASNNHLLNTFGIRFFVTVFGLSAFTVRLPALIGAAVYLWAMRDIVRSLAMTWKLRCLLFAFAVTNPLLLDHLVAARGYSLALGFLALAVALLLRTENSLLWITISCCLSFLANFSFAFAAASVLAAALYRQLRQSKRIRPVLQAAVPGFILIAIGASHTLANWPRGELVYGAQSWKETFTALAEASGYTPNEYLLNPHFLLLFQKLVPVAFTILPLAILVLLIVDLALLPSTQQRLMFGATLAALAVHGILHWYSGTLLPKDRTALWILFFFQILAILLASRNTATIAQSIVSIWLLCHLACLRLDHFKEWKFDANSDQLFQAFECVSPHLRRDLASKHVYSQWPVVSAFNFYRAAKQRWNFPMLEFEYGVDAPPPGRDVYFFQVDAAQEFIDREGLTVVYRDKLSEQGLAIRVPLDRLQDSTCPAGLTDDIKAWRKTLAENRKP